MGFSLQIGDGEKGRRKVDWTIRQFAIGQFAIHNINKEVRECSRTSFVSYIPKLLQEDDVGGFVVVARHGVTNGCTDKGGVADNVLGTVDHDMVAIDILREVDGAGQVSRIVDEDTLESEQVAHQSCEEDGAVFAVTVRVVECLIGEEGPVVAPHLVIVFIDEGRLHPVEEPLGRLQL